MFLENSLNFVLLLELLQKAKAVENVLFIER